jgi:tRNA(adenine34) deaminase
MRTRRERRAGSRQRARRRTPRRWVKTVTSVSTKTPPGLFTRDAATIARTLALPRVSPKGPVSGLRMLSFFINRAGRQLSRSRRAELEKAKRLMRKAIEAERARS